MSSPPPNYYGKILTSSRSLQLRQKVGVQIESCSSFDLLGLKVMPYVAAWEVDGPQIWYEFVSERFLLLFHCKPHELVDVFRNSIIDHRQYHHTNIYPEIKESTLSNHDLENRRNGGRDTTAPQNVIRNILLQAVSTAR